MLLRTIEGERARRKQEREGLAKSVGRENWGRRILAVEEKAKT